MSAFDNAGSVEGLGVNSLSFSLMTSGANRAIVAGVGISGATQPTVTGVTYNAVSLGAAQASVLNVPYVRSSIYAMANPATGANNLACTTSGNVDELTLAGVSATVVHQTTPVRATSNVSASADTNAPSVAVPSAVGDLVVDFLCYESNPTFTLTVNASQTERTRQAQTYTISAMSTEAGAAGNVTMSWAGTGSGINWGLCAVSLQNAPAGGTSINAGVDSLTIGEQVAAVSIGLTIAAALDTLAITERVAQIGLGREIIAGFDELRISGVATGSTDFEDGISTTDSPALLIPRHLGQSANIGAADMSIKLRFRLAGGAGVNDNAGVTAGSNYTIVNSNIVMDSDRNSALRSFILGFSNGLLAFGCNNANGDITAVGAHSDLRGDGQIHEALVCRRESDGRVEGYIDGTRVMNVTGPADDISHPGGTGGSPNDRYHTVGIEKLYIEEGCAIRLFEIVLTSNLLATGASYSVSNAPQQSGTGIVGIYRFGSQATLGEDSSGEGNHAILHGDPGPQFDSETPFPSGLRAAVAISRNVAAAMDALIITERVATVDLQGNTVIAAGLDALVLAEQGAAIALSRKIAAGVDALLIGELAAGVSSGLQISALMDALVITERTATVERDIAIAAQFDQLTLTEQQAVAKLSSNVVAGLDTLVLSEGTAAITLGLVILAAVDQLTISEQQALVQGTSAVVEVIASRIVRVAARQSTMRVAARQATVRVSARNSTLH